MTTQSAVRCSLILTTASREPGQVRRVEPLADHAVEAERLEPVEPRAGVGEVARRRRDPEPVERLDARAPLLERQLPDRLAVPDQHVEDDELGGDLRRQLPDARLGRMEPRLHRVEVERAVARDHDLAVERRVRRQQVAERAQLREVAQQRPLVARPERELAAGVLEHAAEPVPLRLVLPAVALGQLAHELGLHRRERDARARGTDAKPLGLRAMKRVAVTGIGAVTPLGLDAPVDLARRARGRERHRLDLARSTRTACRCGSPAEVKGFDPTQVVSPKEARKLERNVLLGVAAGREALADAGLNGFDPTRVGIIFGSAIGGVPGILEQADTLRERGPDRVSPNFLPNVLVDSVSGQLAISLGIKGPNYAVVSACATGSHAVGEAAEMIKRGAADAVLAGGTESCLVPLILAGFTAMRGLAVEDEDPPRASRPFDATRAGFVMAEGAGALLLEDWERPSGAAPTSTPRCSATAPRTTHTTWRSPSPRRRASRR